MVGDAGVERSGRNGVDDGGVVRLLLVALAVRVDQQGDQTAEDGAAEPHGDHVEEVEVWRKEEGGARRRVGVILCQFAQVEAVIEAAIHMVMSECSAMKKIPRLLKKIKNICRFFFLYISQVKDLYVSCHMLQY